MRSRQACVRARALAITAPALLWALSGVPRSLAAQDTAGVTIDFGDPAPSDTTRGAIPDSVLTMALARFNDPATVRSYGGAVVNAPIAGSLGVHNGDLRVTARVDGDVVVINGSLRLDATAEVRGRIIVLGGRFYPDPGARYAMPVFAFAERAPVRRAGDATLVATAPTPSLRDIAGRAALRVGGAVITPRLAMGVYNRVEGLPILLGPAIDWQLRPDLAVALDADVILRTAREPSDARSSAGWLARLEARRSGDQPFSFGIEAGNQVVATADQPLRPRESSLSALMFRRDNRDWYSSKGVRLFATWRPRPQLALEGAVAVDRERSLPAVDAFSILRGSETWRANPLVDDGRFTTLSLAGTWDTRDDLDAPRGGWWIHLGLRHATSGELTPFLLPELIRDPLPSSGYGALEAAFDVRRYQRIDPRHSLHLRLTGEGWLGGDPLTIQRRVALGGAGYFSAHEFRAITCDSRRRADPARPALCDRRMLAQVELRRGYDVGLSSRVGPYGLGVDRADLLLLADFGTAWLAGDGPGQVPADRIQSLGEWHGALGVGIDAGWLGAYLAKSVTDDAAPRFTIRLQRRF